MVVPIWLFFMFPVQDSNLPIITSALIIFASSFALCFSKNYPFSLRSTILVFVYFFFGIIPLITFTNKITYWSAPEFSNLDYIITNMVILLFLSIFLLIDYLFSSKRSPTPIKNSITQSMKNQINVGKLFPLYLVAISGLVFSFKFSASGFNFYSLWTGGRLGDGVMRESSQIDTLVIHWFITPMLSICLCFYLQIYKKINFISAVLFSFLILAATPVSMSRFSTAVMYLPLIFFSRYILIKPLYNLLLLFSLIIIFPLLHLLRIPFFFQRQSSDFYDYWISIFYSGDFDSYQSLMLVLKYDVVSYGYQLLAPIFFFVPRKFWSEKPLGSGEFLAQEIGLSYNNISASLLTEGYINFGLIGIFLIGIILGVLVSKLDFNYWNLPNEKCSILMRIKYVYSIPAIFFMMRGDLLSSFSSLVGIILAIEFVYLMIKSQIEN
jgi:oligosaccharide repeat unit polymerase